MLDFELLRQRFKYYLRSRVFSKFCCRHSQFPGHAHLLIKTCSGIQFCLLLSPYLCFILLLYLDLYVQRDDALIS